jgi:hypothetical protein
MENTKQETIGQNVIKDTKELPFIIITVDDNGICTLSHSKILDNDFICDILYYALENLELIVSEENDQIYLTN